MPNKNNKKRKPGAAGGKRNKPEAGSGVGKKPAHEDAAKRAELDRLLMEIDGVGGGGGGGGNEEDEDDDDAQRALTEPSEEAERWDPRTRPLQEGEVLEYDSSAYIVNHSMRVEWPCLSFDILRDGWGSERVRFPLTCAIVTGTQAARRDKNQLTVMKLSDMHRTQRDDESESDDSDDDSDDDEEGEVGGGRRRSGAAKNSGRGSARHVDPLVLSRSLPHPGGTNRIRSMPQAPHVVATMADTGAAHVWDVRGQMRQLQIAEQLVLEAAETAEGASAASGSGGSGLSGSAAAAAAAAAHNVVRTKPLQTFTGHPEEGFALAWCATCTLLLLLRAVSPQRSAALCMHQVLF
jgi:hypothetical protein